MPRVGWKPRPECFIDLPQTLPYSPSQGRADFSHSYSWRYNCPEKFAPKLKRFHKLKSFLPIKNLILGRKKLFWITIQWTCFAITQYSLIGRIWIQAISYFSPILKKTGIFRARMLFRLRVTSFRSQTKVWQTLLTLSISQPRTRRGSHLVCQNLGR